MEFAVQPPSLEEHNSYQHHMYRSVVQQHYQENYQLQAHYEEEEMDHSDMNHPRVTHSDFGTPDSVMTPLYQTIQEDQASQFGPRITRRHTTNEFGLSSPTLSDMDHSSLDGMQQSSMGGAYHRAASTASSMHTMGQQMHHHHHLPGMSLDSTTMIGEDGEDNSTSMVGQPGMPTPAPRPRGPKLKFTAEDDQLLIDLKERKNLTWKQISEFFPGRTSGTLQVRYCTKLKAKTTQWTDDMVQRLRTALQEYENEKWRIIAHKVGAGATPTACRERTELLMFEDQEDFHSSPSSMAGIAPTQTSESFYNMQ